MSKRMDDPAKIFDEKVTRIQVSLGIDDTEWARRVGNEVGLLGAIRAAADAYAEARVREARAELLDDFTEWTTLPIIKRDLDAVTLAALRIGIDKRRVKEVATKAKKEETDETAPQV